MFNDIFGLIEIKWHIGRVFFGLLCQQLIVPFWLEKNSGLPTGIILKKICTHCPSIIVHICTIGPIIYQNSQSYSCSKWVNCSLQILV